MQAYLYVMGGGAVGAALRLALSRALPVPSGGWPWATLIANVSGSLAMGLLVAALARDGAMAEGPWHWAIGVGLLGGFTTFSAFSLETVRLVETGSAGMALSYAMASVIASMTAAAAGLMVGRLWGTA